VQPTGVGGGHEDGADVLGQARAAGRIETGHGAHQRRESLAAIGVERFGGQTSDEILEVWQAGRARDGGGIGCGEQLGRGTVNGRLRYEIAGPLRSVAQQPVRCGGGAPAVARGEAIQQVVAGHRPPQQAPGLVTDLHSGHPQPVEGDTGVVADLEGEPAVQQPARIGGGDLEEQLRPLPLGADDLCGHRQRRQGAVQVGQAALRRLPVRLTHPCRQGNPEIG
jgi:hypothetical protein